MHAGQAITWLALISLPQCIQGSIWRGMAVNFLIVMINLVAASSHKQSMESSVPFLLTEVMGECVKKRILVGGGGIVLMMLTNKRAMVALLAVSRLFCPEHPIDPGWNPPPPA